MLRSTCWRSFTGANRSPSIRAVSNLAVFQPYVRICRPITNLWIGSTPEFLLQWAEGVGPQTRALIDATLKSRPFPEQAYRSCLGILSLAKKHPQARIEQACQSALDAKVFSYKAVKEELDWLAKQAALPLTPETLPTHANIRGHEYYQ